MSDSVLSRLKTLIGTRLLGDGLRARAMRGSAFTMARFGFSNLMRLFSNLLMTRLLFPEAFGLMALVMVVISGLKMFSDTGIHQSIVQNKDGDNPVFLNTAWVTQIGRGVLLWAMVCLLANPVALFYEEPQLAILLPVAGITLLIQGFNSTKTATANRHLMLGRLTVIEVASQLLGILMTIAAAYYLRSVWALVIGAIGGSVVYMVLSHAALRGENNRFQFDKTVFLSLFHFGKYIFISTIAGFLIGQGDKAILGKFVTLADLSMYTIAFMFAMLPKDLITNLVNRIIFPLYRTVPPGESAANRAKIAQARYMLTALAFAMILPMALLGNLMITILYDPRYHAAGPLLVLIALATLPVVIVAPYKTQALAAGESGRFATVNIVDACLRTAILFFAVQQFGMVGAALARVGSEIVFYPLNYLLLRKYGGWDFRHDAIFALAALGVAALAVYANQAALADLFSDLSSG